MTPPRIRPRALPGLLVLLAACGGSSGDPTTAEGPGDPPPAAPVFSFLLPDEDARLSAPRDVGIVLESGTIDRVLVRLDGVLAATRTAPPWTWRFDPADYATGTHVLEVRAEFDAQAAAAQASFEVERATLALRFERATPEHVGMLVELTAGIEPEGPATVRYRAVGETAWRDGHPLVRIVPEWTPSGAPVAPVDAVAGTIFDLRPETPYEVEVTIPAASGTEHVLVGVASTRGLPPDAGAATRTAGPGDDLQAAFDALVPGDVLELAAGTYEVAGLHVDVSGTTAEPVTIRGADRASVVLRAATGRVLQLQDTSHLVLENLTLEGSGTDSGTNASSVGVGFWNGARQEFVTLRHLSLAGVDKGIVAPGKVDSVLVYDCDLRGNNEWSAAFVESNLTWNDDGIRLPGEGNCAFQNTLHGFGDAFAVAGGIFSAGVYYYRNLVTMTGDDAFEGDYGTRNLAFYDNHITNCGTLLSLDPLWGGPLYCFRNVAVNTVRGPYKLNSLQSGFFLYNNTVVRTEGTTDWGWVQFNNGALRNWGYRNNVLVAHGPTRLLALESDGNEPMDFTHNGWYPDGSVWWSSSGGSFSTLAGARDVLPGTTPVFGLSGARHDGDVILAREPFETAVPLGADHLTEVTGLYLPVVASESAARETGTPIPNVTDGYSGAAPDMGALIDGRPNPDWGASGE